MLVDGDRQQRGADAVAAHVEQVQGEVLGIDPVIAEGVATELGGRNEEPVDRERLGDGRRQDRAHVALGVAQLLLQPVVGPQQGLARFGQLAVGERELLVGRFELGDEARLALAQQRHVVGLLLDLLRLVVLRRHVEEHDPGRVVLRRRSGCRPRARWACPWSEGERAFPATATDLRGTATARRPACWRSQTRQPVVLQVAARLDQRLFAVDEQMGHGALGLDEQEQPLGNPGRQIQHRSRHHALRQFLEGFLHAVAGLGAGPDDRPPRAFQRLDRLRARCPSSPADRPC